MIKMSFKNGTSPLHRFKQLRSHNASMQLALVVVANFLSVVATVILLMIAAENHGVICPLIGDVCENPSSQTSSMILILGIAAAGSIIGTFSYRYLLGLNWLQSALVALTTASSWYLVLMLVAVLSPREGAIGVTPIIVNILAFTIPGILHWILFQSLRNRRFMSVAIGILLSLLYLTSHLTAQELLFKVQLNTASRAVPGEARRNVAIAADLPFQLYIPRLPTGRFTLERASTLIPTEDYQDYPSSFILAYLSAAGSDGFSVSQYAPYANYNPPANCGDNDGISSSYQFNSCQSIGHSIHGEVFRHVTSLRTVETYCKVGNTMVTLRYGSDSLSAAETIEIYNSLEPLSEPKLKEIVTKTVEESARLDAERERRDFQKR